MASAGNDGRLTKLRGRLRQVLVFSPSVAVVSYSWQMATLAEAGAELAERDVVLLEVRGAGEGTLDGDPLTPEEVRQLRAEHRAGAADFLVVLVGKDGKERFRSNAPVPAARLLGLIDAVPLRPRETHEQPAP
ncbi:MAG: DUF4174 domain-containing protein [Myxococcaceae bacterium]|nr:DUF4174 domain-containing protein [Myxococcaceae bacterium]MCI0669100.1 DUF4174 domain-containing protein [Myxococcaceae bacterium]